MPDKQVTSTPPDSIPILTPGRDDLTFKFVSRPASLHVPYQAPDLPPHFVPRAELLAIKRLLLSRPTSSLAPLTLYGPSGSGKTSLAAALAHDSEVLENYPDGVLWVSLGEEGNVQHAQSVWGEALGADLSHLPDTASRSAALRALLRDLRCLLVIDDVTDVEQIKALNVGGQNCARLITTDLPEDMSLVFKSRRYAIQKMLEDEALALLTEWAGLLPDIYLPTIREIIKRLGNSPVALSLVGAQARQGITWLRLLEVLREDQGIISTLDLSDPHVRSNALGLVVNLVLSRFGGAQLQRSALLGAFASGTGKPFAADAAAACWQMSHAEARTTLDMLAEAALVQRLPGDLYALHKLLRGHLRKAATSPAILEVEAYIRDYYITLVESAAPHAAAQTAEIDAQLGQIMAAYDSATRTDPDRAAIFADALLSYFERRGLWANLVTLADRVVTAAREANDIMREHAYLGDLGYAHTVLGDLTQARAVFERSLTLSEHLGDPPGEASALNNIGAICEREGQYEAAESYYLSSLTIRETLGVGEDIADTLNNLAGVLYWQGRYDEALPTFQRVLDMYRVQGNRRGQAQTQLNIGAVYESLGADVEAQQAYQQTLAIYTNLGDEVGQAQTLNNLGIIYFNRGDTDRALSHFKRSLALKERIGDRHGAASTLNNIALLYEKTGAPSLALEHYEQSYEILAALEDPRAEVVQENIVLLRRQMTDSR
jgi:tetratricopeptide (TPR) repeat protein